MKVLFAVFALVAVAGCGALEPSHSDFETQADSSAGDHDLAFARGFSNGLRWSEYRHDLFPLVSSLKGTIAAVTENSIVIQLDSGEVPAQIHPFPMYVWSGGVYKGEAIALRIEGTNLICAPGAPVDGVDILVGDEAAASL